MSYWSLQDFRASVYFPVVALLDGNNPYDVAQFRHTYPARAPFLLYSPITLLIHLPFGFLSPDTADVIDYTLNLLLLPVLAWMAFRLNRLRPTAAGVFGGATLILLSRSGQSSLHLGQCAVYVAIACYATLYWGDTRPWLAGLALAFASLKMTYAVPLALMIFWRRDFRTLAVGLGLAIFGSLLVLPFLVHAAGGVTPFWHSLVANYVALRTDAFNFSTVASPGRLDAAALVGHLFGVSLGTLPELAILAAILTLGSLSVRRLAAQHSDLADRLTFAVICLTILICAYHQPYDLLLLTAPAVALGSGAWRPGNEPRLRVALRCVLLGLLLVPGFNYLSSNTMMERLGIPDYSLAWTVLTSLNSAPLVIAFLIYIGLALLRPGFSTILRSKQPLQTNLDGFTPQQGASWPLA